MDQSANTKKSDVESFFKIPFYIKVAMVSICIVAFLAVMQVGQQIIIPIVYATLIAILLNPLVNYLTNKRINKIIAISTAVTLTICVAILFLYILSTQINMFSETYPQLKVKLDNISSELIHWVSKTFNIRVSKINAWSRETQSDAINALATAETFTGAVHVMVIGMLLPVYLFMILYYKPLLLEFIHRLFKTSHHAAVTEVLVSTMLLC